MLIHLDTLHRHVLLVLKFVLHAYLNLTCLDKKVCCPITLVKYLKRSNKTSRQPEVCAKVCPVSVTEQRNMRTTNVCQQM